MKFSEGQDSWRSIPEWVSFLIEFGFAWLTEPHSVRRVAVVSMPSDSAAAGLITLGAMRKCLELEDATDAGSHHARLTQLARQRPPGVTLRYSKKAGTFAFDYLDRDGNPVVKKRNCSRETLYTIVRATALDWRIAGEAPAALIKGADVPHSDFYDQLCKEGKNQTVKSLGITFADLPRGAGSW